MLETAPRVAYLSYDGLTDPLGQSQILPYILGLEAKGVEFVVISFEKAGIYQEGKSVVEAFMEGKKITWIPLTYHKKPPVLSTLFDIYLLWRTVRNEHTKNPFSILHCRSYITSLVGLKMKRKTQVKFVFDMRGFWADERVEGGLWSLKNPVFRLIYNYFKIKEKQFLQEADQVISLTDNAKDEIGSWKIGNASISVIPTCVDLNLFDPAKINKEEQVTLRLKLGINEGEFVLLYLGSWGTWYLTDGMLNFFKKLKEIKPDSKFLIVTRDNIEIRGKAFESDIIIAQSTRNQIPLYISLASASICFIKPSFSKKASSATKMGEVMAMNVLVITNPGWGDAERIICRAGGILYNTEILPEINFIENDKLAINTRPYCKEHISLDSGIKKYDKIYREIT